jgi:hypothetical protein
VLTCEFTHSLSSIEKVKYTEDKKPVVSGDAAAAGASEADRWGLREATLLIAAAPDRSHIRIKARAGSVGLRGAVLSDDVGFNGLALKEMAAGAAPTHTAVRGKALGAAYSTVPGWLGWLRDVRAAIELSSVCAAP